MFSLVNSAKISCDLNVTKLLKKNHEKMICFVSQTKQAEAL